MDYFKFLKHWNNQRVPAQAVLTRIGRLAESNQNSLIRGIASKENAILSGGDFINPSGWDFEIDAGGFFIQEDSSNIYSISQESAIPLSVDPSDPSDDRYDLVEGRYKIEYDEETSVDIVNKSTGALTTEDFKVIRKVILDVKVTKGTPGAGVAPDLSGPTEAEIIGTVVITTVDLSTDYNLKIDIDDSGSPVTIDCRGVTPASTTIAEVIAAINAAGFGTIAFNDGADRLQIKSTTSGESSNIKITPPDNNDALALLLGLAIVPNYEYEYEGAIGYFKLGEIRVSAASANLITDDLRDVDRKGEWTKDSATIKRILNLFEFQEKGTGSVFLQGESIDVSLSVGDPAYWDNVGGNWKKASFANKPIGIYTNNLTQEITLFGIAEGFSGLTPGYIYMDSAGSLTSVETDIKIGYAKSATELFIDIDFIGSSAYLFRYGNGIVPNFLNTFNYSLTGNFEITIDTGGATISSNQVILANQYAQAISTPDLTNPRIDIVQIDKDSNISINEGTPSPTPVSPGVDPDNIGLYEILVPAGVGSIVPGNITDIRVYLKASDQGDGSQWGREAIADEAIGTNQIEKTDDSNKIKNENIGNFQIEFEKYHHLVANKGKWYDIKSKSSEIYRKEVITGIVDFAAFTNILDTVKNTINDKMLILNQSGEVASFSIPSIGADPVRDDFQDVTTNEARRMAIAYNGAIPYLIITDYYTLGSGAAEVLRLIELNPTTGAFVSLLANPVSVNKRGAFGITIYNNNIYVAFNANNNTTGKSVDKVSIADAVIEAGGGAAATWTNVLDLTALGTTNLEDIDVDPVTGIFYCIKGNTNEIFAFVDDGTPTDYNITYTFTNNVNHVQYYNNNIYFNVDAAGERVLRYKALSSYSDSLGDPGRIEAVIQPHPESTEITNLDHFSIYEENGLDVLYAADLNNVYVFSNDFQYTLDLKMVDSNDSYLGVIIQEKVHIINDSWEINSLKDDIDIINKVTGRVDGIKRRRDSQYILWAFADADDNFKGFGITRRPVGFASAAINYVNKFRGDQFTINVDQFDDTGDSYGDSNILSHFTIGATIQVFASASAVDNFYIAKIISINISTGDMLIEVIYASHEGPSSPGTAVVNNWVTQIDNFIPYVNGTVQSLYQPKYKIISTVINTNSFGTVIPISWNSGECLYFEEQSNLGILIASNSSEKPITTQNYVIAGQKLHFTHSNGTGDWFNAWDLNRTVRVVRPRSATGTSVSRSTDDKWGFVINNTETYLLGWRDDLDDTRRSL